MDLAATNNQTFIWTVSLAPWALLFNLTTARFQMEIRTSADDPNVALAFDSLSGATGTCVFDPTSKLLTMRAPVAAARRMVAGSYVYGLIATIPTPSAQDPFVKLFATGNIPFAQGIPR